MEATVEIGVEISAQQAAAPALSLRLLGPPAIERGGADVALPRSRKVRALLAYLALAGRAATRSHLCELLWDLPNDPRGELRWSLSKVRTVLDAPERPRVRADGDRVALELADCSVDALEVLQAVQEGLARLPLPRLEALAGMLARGDLLEGLDLPRAPAFTGWLLAERRRFRAAHAAVLEHWVAALPEEGDARLAALARWLAVAPFDLRAHQWLLDALAARGRIREGDDHLAAAARQFEAEGQDWAPVGLAWRAAKSRHAARAAARIEVLPPVAPLQAPEAAHRRASLAVMPFVDRTPGVPLRGGLADGMAHDVITRLAKLRSMFVIAEGTMFALAERRVGSGEAGRRLDTWPRACCGAARTASCA